MDATDPRSAGPALPEFVMKAERTAGHELLEQLLAQVRNAGKPWALYSEAEQTAVIASLRAAVESSVSYLVRAIAGQGRTTVTCDVDAVTFKKRVKVSMSLARGAAASDLAERAGGQVQIVLLEANEHLDGVEQVRSDKGQTDFVGGIGHGG